MGIFDSAKDKATEGLDSNKDKVEEVSDQGLEKGGQFAEDKGVGSDQVDKGKEFLDGKIGE